MKTKKVKAAKTLTKKPIKRASKKVTKKIIKKAAKNITKNNVKKAIKKAAKSSAVTTHHNKVMASSKVTTKVESSGQMIGKKVPEFSVKNSKNEDVSLTNFNGKTVVLYFYPKDDTPGCTIEGNEFTALVDKFKAKNAVVLGVSRDSVQSHHKFICKYDYKIELLSDSEEKLCRFFDVIKEKNMYGKMVMGIERSTFIIDPNGVITKEYRKVKAEGHAAEVLSNLDK